MNTLRPPPLPSRVSPASVVVVSAAQVWSAAVQNISIALIIGGLMLHGSVSTEFGLIALSAISGIDLFGRLRAKASGASALAIGATGMLHNLPHLLVALALGSALFSGCGLLSDESLKAAKTVIDVAKTGIDQAVYACTLAAEVPELDEFCRAAVEAKKAADKVPDLDSDAGAP